jgi:cytochrome c oxidase subunit 1
VQHWLGNEGFPRRYGDYQAGDGFTELNMISTIGSFITGISTLPFLYNVWKSYKSGPVVEVDDPWGHGNSLEWATTSPPPLRNFDRLPRIRSERPAFDLKFPHLAAGGQSLAGPPEGGAKPLTSESDHGASYTEDVDSDIDR